MKVLLDVENCIDILQVAARFQCHLLCRKIIFPLITALAEEGTTAFLMQPRQPALIDCPVSQVIEAAPIKQVNLIGDRLPVISGQRPRVQPVAVVEQLLARSG